MDIVTIIIVIIIIVAFVGSTCIKTNNKHKPMLICTKKIIKYLQQS